MGVGHQRRQDGGGSAHPVRANVLFAGFREAPPIVAAPLDPVDHLPEFPADIAHEQVSGHRMEAHPPRIAQSIGPDFSPGVGQTDKRIVLGNGVSPVSLRVVDIEAQHTGQKIADVLPGDKAVRRVRFVGITR